MTTYLITGGGGFIGSHLAHALVEQGAHVRVLDDFSTGSRDNLAALEDRIELIKGSICDRTTLDAAMAGADYCLHQAAIPSVPRSVAAPWATNKANVEGTLFVFLAARDAGVKRVVYASSSSVYGNAPALPLTETMPPAPRSPYAVSKTAGEMYARVFSDLHDVDFAGLRYFNVFGPRQDPDSPYAAVIPLFIKRMLQGKRPCIFGDGRQARDFTYVDNVVQANLAACAAPGPIRGVYNIACSGNVSLLELVERMNRLLDTNLDPEFLPPKIR